MTTHKRDLPTFLLPAFLEQPPRRSLRRCTIPTETATGLQYRQLATEAVTGWTDDYLWDNGVKGTIVVIPNITTSRTYTCQFASQSGAVSESKFHLNVVPALQSITVDGGVLNSNTAEVFPGSDVTFTLTIPEMMNPEDIVWQDGTKGTELYVENIKEAGAYTATYHGLLSVEIYVAEGEDLTFGIKEPTNDTTWLVFDNFTLTCTGSVSTGIEGINADSKTGDDSIYDLTGRKMQTTALPKGIYIQNGRKFVIK